MIDLAETRAHAEAHHTHVYRGMGNGTTDVERWRGLVAAYFPANQVDRGLCVMRGESGGNAAAKNPRSSARGLFQIMASVWAKVYGVTYAELYDPVTNVRIAADIWSREGWWPWAVYARGACR